MDLDSIPREPVEPEVLDWVVALQDLSLEMLDRIAARTFDDTDGGLFALARRAKQPAEQRQHLDAMYALRKLRPSLIEELRSLFADGFAALPAPPDAFADPVNTDSASMLQGMYPWEEWIDLSSLVARLEQVHALRLEELGLRVQALQQRYDAPIQLESLMPAAFVLPFAQSAVGLGLAMEVTRLMFERLERVLARDLDTLYLCAIEDLDAQGLGPQTSAEPDAEPMEDVTPTTPEAERVYDEDALRADLATLARRETPTGWSEEQVQSYGQRAGAVEEYFDELQQDSALAASLKPALDRLRYPYCKIALQDTAFFCEPQHPARVLLAEFVSLAYVARLSGALMLDRVERMLRQMPLAIEVAATALDPQMSAVSLLDRELIERFRAELKDEARRRRQSMIGKVRRLVAEKLRVHTLGRKIPVGLQMLLSSGWAPMLALRLLRQGADSAAASAGMRLLHGLIEVSDPDRAASFDALKCNALQQDISSSLHDAGMTAAQVEELVRAWRQDLDRIVQKALAQAEAALASHMANDGGRLGEADFGEELFATAAPQEAQAALPQTTPEPTPSPEIVAQADALPEAPALLELLVAPGSWLCLIDSTSTEPRWLRRLLSPDQTGDIVLAGLSDADVVRLEPKELFDQLLSGAAETVELSPLGEYWLQRLRQDS